MPKPSRRRWTLLLTVMTTVLVSVPAAVWASHQFTDVPNSHIFHTGISWMKDNNITVGCNPPANTQYCPDDNVTRGQMATFMKRLAENNVVDAATLDGKDSTDYLSVTSAQTYDHFSLGNIELPAAGIPIVETVISAPMAGHLIVTGTAAIGNAAAGIFYTVWLELDDGACGITLFPDNSIPGASTNMSNDGGGDDGSAAVSSLVAVAAGNHTLTLCGATTNGSGDAFNASVIAQFVGDGSVTALSGLASTGGGDGGPQG